VLYQLLEWQRAAMLPWAALARRARAADPAGVAGFAYAPGLLVERGLAAAEPSPDALPQALARAAGRPVTARVLSRTAFSTLRAFAPCDPPPRRRVLLLPPYSGYASSVLAELAAALFARAELVVVDWSDARLVPAAIGPYHLARQIEEIRALLQAQGPELHVVAVSQGAVPALAATALLARAGGPRPRSLALIGGPIDPQTGAGRATRALALQPLAVTLAQMISTVPPRHPGAGRPVFPGALQLLGFCLSRPAEYLACQAGLLVELAGGPQDGHARRHADLHSVVDVPAELFADMVQAIYRDSLLARGGLVVGGQRVEPAAIARTALLTIEGEADDLVGPGQTHAAHALLPDLAASRRASLTVAGAAHHDLFQGSRFQGSVAPAIASFQERHSLASVG
jgi:poly(3-hydroxybutyrate) depolymerase